MKYAILLIALSIALSGCAVPGGKKSETPESSTGGGRAYGESRDECLRAIRRARLDARSGSYRMYVYRPVRNDSTFSRVLSEHMKTSYGIELVTYGPEDRDRDKCYSNEMDKIILNTFGPDILAKAEQEAEKIVDSQK